jgi:hypothetical protein
MAVSSVLQSLSAEKGRAEQADDNDANLQTMQFHFANLRVVS